MAGDGFTFVELAEEALKKAPHPLDRRELWDFAVKCGLHKKVSTAGKTPWETLGARVYVLTAEDMESPFVRVGARPTRFWLRVRPLPKGWSITGPDDAVEPNAQDAERRESLGFRERELHPLVAHFAHEKLGGLRVKTIRHEASKKSSFGEWVHPDLIGVRFPMVGLNAITASFSVTAQASLLRLLSFEVKKRVDWSNLRECFFQTVSNSSWAHEGYLIAPDWHDDPDFRDELERLCSAFGVGALQLSLADPSSGRVLIPARRREELDWTTLDKLVAMNEDVRSFLESVRIDVGANRIHATEYDPIPADPGEVGRRLLVR